jgi:uncharacterized protein (TIGR02444 family)
MNPPAQLTLDNPLWQSSLALWSNPSVAESCLQLQASGCAVSRLLVAIWLAGNDIAWDGVEPDAIEQWRQGYTVTYRQLRMSLSKDNPISIALRKQTQAAELASEKIELAWIYHLLRQETEQAGERKHLDGGHISLNTRYNAELLIANLKAAAPDVSTSLQGEHGMAHLTKALLGPGNLAEPAPSPGRRQS